MIDRRFFLKLTGFVAAAAAFRALPVVAQGDAAGELVRAGCLQLVECWR